ncbi:MAG: class I SAM-dependent methyltransferase, partial [Proteobacteria bacterium]|nr:class I SAM-dependent methyltransferase [Pseudomonadota bacterium]
ALAGCSSTPPKPAAATAGAAPPAATKPAPAPPGSDAATLAALDRVLAGAHRSDANRSRDIYRHPHETLAFFGVREDMTVMEIWPGAGGWYTEVLAPLLRDHGRYIAAGWDPASDSKFVQDGIRAFRAKLEDNPALYGKVEVTALQYPNALAPVPPGSVDLVVTFRNLHNWLARDEAATAVLKAIYAALKPGGILGVVDHRADPAAPVDPRARLGYVNEAYAIDLIKAAGFEFLGASEVNANPKDTRDYEQGVWTLPPTWRLGDKDRERYAAIGESDRFTLRFRKPAPH